MNITYIAKKEHISENITDANIFLGENAIVSLDSSWNDENKNAPFSRVYFIIEGWGEISVNGKKTLLEPGKIYFIPIGSDMQYKCNDRLLKLYFHMNVIDRNGFDIFEGAKNVVIIDRGIDYIKDITKAYTENTYRALLKLKSCLYKIIEEAYSESEVVQKQLVSYSHHVSAAMEYIKNNLSIKLDNRSIAQELFVSESFLSKHFKAEVGITIGQYIDKLVFFSAQQQLLEKELSIHEISSALGFCDQFYFSRRFRKLFGCSPAVYRKYYINSKINGQSESVLV